MRDRLMLFSGLLALLVGFAGLLGTTTVMATRHSSTSMMSNRNVPYDLRFLDSMIMHHQGAVMSSKMMIAGSRRPKMRALSAAIVRSQTDQIHQMRQWRREWYSNAPVGGGMMACERLRGDHGMRGMGDMMGGDTDRMFLRMMIPHHQLAVDMANEALSTAQHPEVRSLARTIISEQTAEIGLMQGYLRTWYGEDATAWR